MTETSEQAPSRRRVIVADDDETIATTLAIILNQAGFEARAVFSGEQVVKLLDSFQPEMLITDVAMPGMTGIELAITVRNRLSNCKILLFSGQAATADLLEQAKMYGHEFEIVAKPIHPTDLLAKMGVSNAVVHAHGSIEDESPIDRVLTIADKRTGTTVLEDLYKSWRATPIKVDLAGLWSQLGISDSQEGVIFDDSAPLASVRDTIIHP
jgi:DNA-binding response OmpR family regulator